jgi:chromosome segregation ATPase
MLRFFRTALLALALCGIMLHARGEGFSPWDAWRQGYSHYERGEKAKARNEAKPALEAFLQARDCYLAVKKARPDWNQQIIDNRLRMCNREINALREGIDRTAVAQQALPPPLQDTKQTVSSQEIVTSHGNTYEITRELEKYKKEFLATVAERDKLLKEVERNRSIQLEIANLTMEKTALEQRLANLQRQNEILAAKQNEPEQEKKELQNRLLEERMKLDIADQRLKLQDGEVNNLKKEVNELLLSRNEAREKEETAGKKLLVLERQITDAAKLAQLRQTTTAELEKQYAELNKESELQKVRLKNQQSEITRLNEALAGSQTAAQQLTDNRELAKKLTEASVERERLSRENAEMRKQNRETEDALKSLRENAVHLSTQRDQTAQSLQSLTEQHGKLLDMKASFEKQIKELTVKNQETILQRQDYIDKYEKAQKRLETRLSSEYENILALTKQVKDEQEKLRQSHEEMEKIRTLHAQSQEQSTKLAETVQELKDKLTTQDDSGKQLLSVSDELRKLRASHGTLQEEHKKLDQENRANALLAARFQTASEQLKQLTESKAELDVLKVKYRQSLETIEELKTAAATAPQPTAPAPVPTKEFEQKIADYEQKLTAANNLLRDSREQLRKSTEQQENLSRQLKTDHEQLTAANTQLRQTREQLAEAEKQVQENSNARQELTLQERQLAVLKESLSATESQLRKEQETLKELPGLKKELATLRHQVERQAETAAATATGEAALVKKLQEELGKNSGVLASLRSEITELQKLQKQEAAEKNRLQEFLKIQEEKNSNSQTEITRLAAELETAVQKARDFEKQKQEYAASLTVLKREHQTATDLTERLRAENVRNNELVAKLRQSLTGAENSLREKATAGSDELLQRQLTAASEIHRRQLGERDTRITRLEQRTAMDATARKQLENDLEQVRKKLAVLEATRQSELAAIENFNRTFPSDLAKAFDNKPRMTPEEVSFHSTELLAVGASAEKEDEIEVALWNYRKILEFDPEHLQANARLGSICLKKGMYKEAANHFNTVLKKDPLSPQVNLEYSLCLFELKDYLTAEKILSEAVRNHSSDNSLRSARASALTRVGRPAEAEKELRSILAAEPNRLDAMVYLAEALAENGDTGQETQNLYRQARKQGAPPVPRLEKLFSKTDDRDDAKQFLYQSAAEAEKNNDTISSIWYYAQIRKLEGDRSRIANRLAILQLQNDKAEDALNNIRNRRDDAESQLLAGLACAMMEKYLDAAAYFRISGRLKQNGFAYTPEVQQLARKTDATLSTLAAREGNQSLEAAREALRNTVE